MSLKTFLLLSLCFLGGLGTAVAQTTKGSGSDLYNEKLLEVRTLIGEMTVDEKISQLTNWTPGIARLGIKPYNWWSEALHGVARNGRATVFPMPIGLGATFDPQLIHDMADAIATEARAKFQTAQQMENYSQYAGLTFWSPNINIFRDARWGRGMETYGEDPLLTGTLGTAFVLGLQGDDPFYLKASACAKHYAVHSGPESTRHSVDVSPSPRDLRETYLPAFQMLVQKGQVESVMGAYNRVYGESASASELLLKKILREEWGFNGHVVSDCGAVTDIVTGHHMVPTEAEAAAMAVKNGLNVECGNSFNHLKEALDQGLISEADLDEALIPLFMTRAKLGILTPDARCPYNNTDPATVGSPAHAAIALRAAEESMVMLKNDGDLLPLKKDIKNMFVMGPGATDAFTLMGNYFGLSSHYTTYLEGILSKVSLGTTVNYRQGFLIASPSAFSPWSVGEFLNQDVSILFVGNDGNTEGEEGDAISSPASGDRENIRLPESQLIILREIAKRRSENPGRYHVVTVVTGGSPVEMKEIEEASDAIVFAWYPGQAGGEALANLLFGDAQFSGRLPMTFPTTVDNLPPLSDYTMQGRTYKYQSTDIHYPFGYGLTYGQMEYSALEVSTIDHKNFDGTKALTASCTITNRSRRDATEVAQLYLSTPGAGTTTPIASLLAFQRVEIPAGESRQLSFTITPDQFLSILPDGQKLLTPGPYTIRISAAAPGPRSEQLRVPAVAQTLTIEAPKKKKK